MRNFLLIVPLLFCISTAWAEDSSTIQTKEPLQKCLETSVGRADESMTIKALTEACNLLLQQEKDTDKTPNTTPDGGNAQNAQNGKSQPHLSVDNTNTTEKVPQLQSTSVTPKEGHQHTVETSEFYLLHDRLTMEALNRSNRFILMPHKRNYLLPISYSSTPNNEPYSNTDTTVPYLLNSTETDLQLSVKILMHENIFANNGHLYLGYTNHALWQVYNRRLSAPFRETDHQPELILSFTSNWEIFGFRNSINEAVVNHQSNGQTGVLSRSWNRIMLNSVFEKGNLAVTINPWYRLREGQPTYPGDPRGDDNPDISKYMGHFELSSAYKYKSDIFSVQIRNNLSSENYGAIELGWTFPVTKTMRGFMSYFDGYGHSLIDYNAHQQVLGLGIIFADLF
jgi:phospholipase A1/A2